MKRKFLNSAILAIAAIGLTLSAVAAPNDIPTHSDQSQVEANYRIAVMYDNGDGFKRDYAKAAKWYVKAAALGHILSLN
ncbi:MAG: hypothetical protein ACTIJH_09625 [Moraxellaceae bacterium]